MNILPLEIPLSAYNTKLIFKNCREKRHNNYKIEMIYTNLEKIYI
jgi:hypothetical protein